MARGTMTAGATMATAILIALAVDAMEAVINSEGSLNIFLCRHGETEWTISGRHTSISDIPLTENGKKQAIMLGKRLKNIRFQKIIVSPMIRAQQTCELACPRHPKIIEPNVMEWNYGEYEGLTTVQIQEMNLRWNIFDDGARGGESPEEVSARADHFLKSLAKERGNIAIFSHGHFSRVLAMRWIGWPAGAGKYFCLSVASISILGHEKDERAIKLWNECETI